MPDKQKVTLYISGDLHRQFKIRSAVDGETMSSMAQHALEFYLGHPELVEGAGVTHGKAHQVHSCPQCSAAVSLRDGELMLVNSHSQQEQTSAVEVERISDLTQETATQQLNGSVVARSDVREDSQDSKSPDEGELVTC